jgi:hypothetical protein
LKIAFDENVPIAMVRVFQTFANERQLQKITGKFEIKSAMDYTPRPGEADYVARSDVPWLRRFADDSGKVVITGNTEMRFVPHERLALIECGFVVFFFEGRWSSWKFFRKCSLLLHWWPEIATKVKKAKPGSFWAIPGNWPEKGKLRKLSNEDPKLVKARRKRAMKSQKKKPASPPSIAPSPGPLFEYANQLGDESGAPLRPGGRSR